MPAPTVTDNTAEHRFESEAEGGVAVLDYRLEEGRLALLHTEVPPEAEGAGVASALVRAAFDRARAEGLRIVPVCPFVATWLARHPEQRELVDSADR